MKTRNVIVLAFCLIAIAGHAVAQFTGGFEPGQPPSTKVEKSKLSPGAVSNNVDLFTGTLSLSYDFGSVATLSGLSFPIRLQHGSTSLLAFEHEQNSGIPYGEGWSLAEASITIENYAFDFIPADNLPTDLQNRNEYTKEQAQQRGALYFANPTLRLPNGTSGRLVYKYPLQSDSTKSVFILQGFQSYTEAIFDGYTWEVITDDGTRWLFGEIQRSYRNSGTTTARMADTYGDMTIPRAQIDKWHLVKISNPNHANLQNIILEYEKHGRFEMYPELRQQLPQTWLKTYNGTQAILIADSAFVLQNPQYNVGDSIFILKSKYESEDVFRNILLKSVTAQDGQGSVISRVDLKYRSYQPDQHYTPSSIKIQRGKFLLLSDPQVLRNDSLYSRKTVWFRGRDLAVSRQHAPSGQRSAISDTLFSNGWMRYQHPAAYQNAVSQYGQNLSIHPKNPYLVKFANTNIPGLSPTNGTWYWQMKRAIGQASGSIPFTHSVLESPRLQGNLLERLPAGDMYEIRTAVKVPQYTDMNFDLALVSGVTPINTPNGFDPVQKTVLTGGDSVFFKAYRDPALFPNNGYDDKSYSIFSTFRRPAKWNPMHQNPNGVQYMVSRNLFRMPNLPNEFDGFHVQIGPAADNLKYNESTFSNDGYPYYYENRLNGFSRKGDRDLVLGSWFGTGAPWEPLFEQDRFFLFNGAGYTGKGTTQQRHKYWYLPLAGQYASSSVSGYGPSQPTALTKESLSGASGTFSYTGRSLNMAHNTPEDAELWNMEIVRIAKNPYMLDSVIFSVQNGRYGTDMYTVKAFKLNYDFQQVKVLNNVDHIAPLQDPVAASAAEYKKINGQFQYRNIFQLQSIERLHSDSVGAISAVQAPITRFEYYTDNDATPFIQEATLLQSVWNELGGKQTFTYDLATIDTVHINSANRSTWPDRSHLVIGRGVVSDQHITVASKIIEAENGSSQIYTYEFVNPVRLFRGYKLDEHFDNAYNPRSKSLVRRGFERATVKRPSISGNGSSRTEYTHRIQLNSAADSLLFGKLGKVEEFTEQGQLISRVETKYEAKPVYHHGLSYEQDILDYNQRVRVKGTLSAVQDYEANFVLGSADRWQTDSWFIRRTEQSTTDRDETNGNTISKTQTFTHYDWDINRNYTSDVYEKMYNLQLATNHFQITPYFHTASGEFSYSEEPSFQLARATTRHLDKPGAYEQEERFYLWDIGTFLNTFPSGLLIHRAYDSYRPYFLSKDYGIRGTAYEIKKTVFNGDPKARAYAKSSYYWYDIFADVGADFVEIHDSTGWNSLCDTQGDSITFRLSNQTMTYCTGLGEPVDAHEIICEISNDPRYVKDQSGQWYVFPVNEIKVVSYDAYQAMADLDVNSPTSGCPAGFAAGPDGQVKYFGTFEIAGGGGLPATNLDSTRRNYGTESVPASPKLTAKSKQKVALVALLPHVHAGDSGICDMAHSVLNDSVLNASLKPGPLPTFENGSNARQKFIDVLANQFFLRAIYEQADSVPNVYAFSDSAHNQFAISVHNIFDTVNTYNNYLLTPYQFVFRPLFPTIRSYAVHQRNMHGKVVEDSDIRGLHRIYEYEPAIYGTWFDNCGNRHTGFRRYWHGLPRSVTQTDFGALEATTILDYHLDNSLKGATLPNGERESYAYDGLKRLVAHRFNGVLREEHQYQSWAGNITDSWQSRTQQNQVQTVTYDGPGRSQFGVGYMDPLGREAQTIIAVQDGQSWTKRFGGRKTYDKWNRLKRSYRPYAKTNQADPWYDGTVPNQAFAASLYENDARGRGLRLAKPGNAINTARNVKTQHRIITLRDFQQETGASSDEIRKLFPMLTAIGISGNGGGSGGGARGNRIVRPQVGYRDIKLYKTQREDEDGKRSISYRDAQGRQIATLAYADATYSDKILTLFVGDVPGNPVCIIHPNKLRTLTKRNFQGWPYFERSSDAGEKRIMYNQAGDQVYVQDANQKAQGRFLANDYDRMGRMYRQSTVELSPLNIQGASYIPLHYADTLGVQFHNLHTIRDDMPQSEANCSNQVFSLDFSQSAFPCLNYNRSQQRKEKEYRYDYAIDSNVTAYHVPSIISSLLAPVLATKVASGQQHLKGRMAAELAYDGQGNLNEVSVYSYHRDGEPAWMVRQFRPAGITPMSRGSAHVVDFPEYDFQHRPRAINIDLEGDGQLDIQHYYNYDKFGRLEKVFLNRSDVKDAGHLVASYQYVEATGKTQMVRYYTASQDCQQPVVADSIQYVYDQQDRVLGLDSRFFQFRLFYDFFSVNSNYFQSSPVGAGVVQESQNFNGNVNGWRAEYKVAGEGVTGFDGQTVYGFQYDGANRLVQADASVLEQSFATSSTGFLSGGTYGTALTTSMPSLYGDARYVYDKVGNLTGLRRHWYFAPGSVPTARKGDNWKYGYAPFTNQLTSLSTGGQATVNLSYDANGNLTADSKRGLSNTAYNASNLIQSFQNGSGKQVSYTYGSSEKRIYKQVTALGQSSIGTYYLRAGDGKTLARWSDADSSWTLPLYGTDLIGEYNLTADRLDSAESAPSSLRKADGRGKALLRKGRNLVLGALVAVSTSFAASQESVDDRLPVTPALLVPVVAELFDQLEQRLSFSGARSSDQDAAPDSIPTGIKFYVKDHLGNVRIAHRPSLQYDSLTHSCILKQEIVSVIDYFPYGKVLRAYYAEGPERIQTTLHERDQESGLDYRGARMYDADYARFLGVDPMAHKFADWNPYTYVLANPIIWIDPDGRMPGDPGGLTTERLRSLANALGIEGNNNIGEWFERIATQAVQSHSPIAVPNGDPFPSNDRRDLSRGRHSFVVPDMVGPRIGINTVNGVEMSMQFYEVKATKSRLTPSYRHYQLVGMIEAVAEARIAARNNNQNDGHSVITLATTSNTRVSQKLLDFASRNGVFIYQMKAQVTENGLITFSQPERLNLVPGTAAFLGDLIDSAIGVGAREVGPVNPLEVDRADLNPDPRDPDPTILDDY